MTRVQDRDWQPHATVSLLQGTKETTNFTPAIPTTVHLV